MFKKSKDMFNIYIYIYIKIYIILHIMIKYHYIIISSNILYNDVIINDTYYQNFPLRGPYNLSLYKWLMIIIIFMHIIIKYRSIFLWDFLTFEPAQRFFFNIWLVFNRECRFKTISTRNVFSLMEMAIFFKIAPTRIKCLFLIWYLNF